MQQADLYPLGPHRLEALVTIDLDEDEFHLGVLELKATYYDREQPEGGRAHKADDQASGLSSVGSLGSVTRFGRCLEDRADVSEVRVTSGRKNHSPLVPGEQIDPQLTFQPSNLLAQVRLGDVQPSRRTREMELLGHGEEKPQMPVFHAPLICRTTKFSNRKVLDVSVIRPHYEPRRQVDKRRTT
jgi:hypothetical protein